jgi:hypothetical protein
VSSKLPGQEGEGRQSQEQELEWVGDEVKSERVSEDGGWACMEVIESGEEEGNLSVMRKSGSETVLLVVTC